MNHQHFETWLLDEANLTEDERKLMNEHLAGCEECQMIQRNWAAVQGLIRSAPEAQPRAGFTTRWQANLEHRKEEQAHRRSRQLIFAMIGSVALLLLISGAIALNNTSPVEILVSIIRSITQCVIGLQQLQKALSIWLRIGLNATTISLGLALAVWLTAFGLTITITYFRNWKKGGITIQ